MKWPPPPRVALFRDDAFPSPLHSERNAAALGAALGVTFSLCFATGLLSHLIQNPPNWFTWTPRPAGLYRITQGLHVASGLASIPLLFAKLWTVYPKLFGWPPFRSVAQALERLSLLPMIGGALFLLFSGLGNINIWRPWNLSYRPGHYWAAWVTMGGLVVHIGAKFHTTRAALFQRDDPHDSSRSQGPASNGSLSRRGFLGTIFGAAGIVTLFTIGETFRPLRKFALLAPRRPDTGPQGFPVNRTAQGAGLTHVDVTEYRLTVRGKGVKTPLSLTLDELRSMPQHEATLPIACVEGWSTSQRWRGVRVRDLLARVGAPRHAEARVISMEANRYSSELNHWQAHDPDTLLALEVNGEPLAPDHGFPVRLIGPNRPGVQQTKWVERVEVT